MKPIWILNIIMAILIVILIGLICYDYGYTQGQIDYLNGEIHFVRDSVTINFWKYQK